MARNSIDFCPTGLLERRVKIGLCVGICKGCRRLAFGLLFFAVLAWTDSIQAVLLWGDLGATQVHETGVGTDILDGGLRRGGFFTNKPLFLFSLRPFFVSAPHEEFL